MLESLRLQIGGMLYVSNTEGKPVAGIAADADGGLFKISNKDGETSCCESMNTADGGALRMDNKDGKPVAGIGATADGAVLEDI